MSKKIKKIDQSQQNLQDYFIANMLCLEIDEVQKLFEDALKRKQEQKDGKYLVKSYKKLSKKEIINLQEKLRQSKQRKEAIEKAIKRNDIEELGQIEKENDVNSIQVARREQFNYLRTGRELMIQKEIDVEEVKKIDEEIEKTTVKIAEYRQKEDMENAIKCCEKELMVLEEKMYRLIKQHEDELTKLEEKQAPKVEKTDEVQKQNNEKKVAELERQLKQSAERMKEYKRAGFSEQEAEEHKNYNEIVRKLRGVMETEEKPLQYTEKERAELERQLKQSAKRMEEYKRAGFSEQEAEEHKNYNEIVRKLRGIKETEIQNKEKRNEKKEIKLKTKQNEEPLTMDFDEIYNKTFTSPVGNIAYNINKLAHMKLLGSKKGTNKLQKILNIPLAILKAPVKLLAKIPNSIMRTDKKMAEITENINNLNAEEFKSVVQNLDELNKNNAYLNIVKTRLEREQKETVELDKSISDRLGELEAIGEDNWTQEQKTEYFSKLQEYMGVYPDKMAEYKKQLKKFNKKANKRTRNIREELKIHKKDSETVNENNLIQTSQQEIKTSSPNKNDEGR